MVDISKITDAADAAKKAKDKVVGHENAHEDGQSSNVHREVQQEMQRQSKGQRDQVGQLTSALNEGKISDVLQDKIRRQVLSSLPQEQSHIYQQEEQRFGREANKRGPAHLLVEKNVQQAEHMILGQAIRQSGVGRIHDVEDAIRVFKNPRAARQEDWIKIGLTVGTHGLLPPEISNRLSSSIAHQSTQFFNGRGHGTFSEVQQELQVGMRAIRPYTEKIAPVASEAASKGKEAATGIGRWVKGHVIDPAEKKMKHEE